MDRKKKIITVLGCIVFIALLGGFCWYMFVPSTSEAREQNKISIAVPKVDENKIPKKSKFEQYQKEGQDGNGSKQSKTDLFDFDLLGGGKSSEPDSSASSTSTFEDRLNLMMRQDSLNEAHRAKTARETNKNNEEQALSSELMELMEMQNQFLSQTNPYESTVIPSEVENLLEQYDQAINGLGLPQSGENSTVPTQDLGAPQDSQNPISDLMDLPKKIGMSNYFQGAGSIDSSDNVRDLIPVETVDEGLLVNGSTIALRTKKTFKLNNPVLLIPKGSVIYGKVTISTDRLNIEVNAYKEGLKLYLLNFVVYDFDGREGVHLGNRTWPKIPSKVAEEVYEYAYQKGTQASTFGGDGSIDLDQAKDIAILSAAKNIGNEIFEKRKVFMPKKYHLWFNIESN